MVFLVKMMLVSRFLPVERRAEGLIFETIGTGPVDSQQHRTHATPPTVGIQTLKDLVAFEDIISCPDSSNALVRQSDPIKQAITHAIRL
jgi:hypothetical protein